MATNDDNMKDVFLSGSKKDMLYMLDHLKTECDISEADYWNYIGYYVIHVPKEQYEYALREGKKFATEEDFGMYWLDHYNVRRSPICSSDVGYALLPHKPIKGETEKSLMASRYLWSEDEYTPTVLKEYYKAMKEYLMVEKIYRTYNSGDDALILAPQSIDYEEQVKLFRKFVKEHGYDPFDDIHTLSFTGKLRKNSIQIKNRQA